MMAAWYCYIVAPYFSFTKYVRSNIYVIYTFGAHSPIPIWLHFSLLVSLKETNQNREEEKSKHALLIRWIGNWNDSSANH